MNHKNTLQKISITLTVAFLSIQSAFAEEPTSILVGFTDKEEANIKAIEKALDQPAELELKETPLAELPKLLSKQMGIQVHLDKAAFEDASIDIDEEKFTRKIKKISYRAALKLLVGRSKFRFYNPQRSFANHH